MKTEWTDVKVDNDTTQPDVADPKEVNDLINLGVTPTRSPITPIGGGFGRANPAPHFNQFGVDLSPVDMELVQIVDTAIKNGWKWQEYVSESIIVGTEAVSVVKKLKQHNANARDFLLNIEFAQALWGKDYEDKLKLAVVEPDILKYIKSTLDD